MNRSSLRLRSATLRLVLSGVWVTSFATTACKESPPQAPPAESATAAVPSANATPPATPTATAPEPVATAPTPSAASASPEPQTNEPSPTPSYGKVTLSGCLVAPKGMPERGATLPSDKLPKVEVKNGVVPRVVHHLDHACCLSATTDVNVEANSVTLTEHLSGTPCRCRCSSTIQADLNVAAGDYTLRVLTEQNGKTEEAFSGSFKSGSEAPKEKPQLPKHIHVPAAGQ